MDLFIPTGIPFVYEFDSNLKVIKNYYLATDEEVNAKNKIIKNEGKIKK